MGYDVVMSKSPACEGRPDLTQQPANHVGVLHLTGHGNERGIYLRDSDGRLVDIDLPAEWQGKKVWVSVHPVEE